jgi:hypothetical protein
MANYYWVGGNGTWDASTTTNWASTSGGAGGAGVPTSADNAYFDDESDTGAAFTVTIGTGAVCKDVIIGDGVTVDALDQTMTLAGSAAWVISGSLYFPATSFTRTFSGNVTFNATTTGHTITMNGQNLNSSNTITFDGAGGEWTFGSTFNQSVNNGNTFLTQGTLNTNNYNMNIGKFRSSNSNVRALNLGSSTINTFVTSSSNAPWDINTSTNMTFDCGTSTIIVSGGGNAFNEILFNGGSLTYYIVLLDGAFTNASPTVYGDNTFYNLSNRSNQAASCGIYIAGNQTVTNKFSFRPASTAITSRSFLTGVGTVTITAASVEINCCDVSGINAAGAASWTNGVDMFGVSDLLGNTGFDFVPKTVYWNLAGSQNWSATAWATTPTGTPADANFPLAQDTAVVTEAGAAGTITINSGWRIGTLTFDDGVSTRTSAATLNFSSGPTFYGDLKLSSGTIISGTGTATFAGRNTQNITGAGKTFTNGITLDSPGGTLVLQDNLTLGTDRTFTLTQGALNLNNKVASFGRINSSNTNNRTFQFGSGKIQISGDSARIFNITFNSTIIFSGTKLFEFTYSGSSGTREIFSTVATTDVNNLCNISITNGSDSIVLLNSAPYINIDFSGFSGVLATVSAGTVIYGNLTLSPTMTITPTTSDFEFVLSSGLQTIRSNGITLDLPITKSGEGTLRLEDNITMGSTRQFIHSQGTVNLNGKNLSCNDYSTSNSNIRNLTFGSGQILLQGTGAVWNATTSTNMTITPGTGKIVLADNSNTARTFAGGGITTYPELEIAGDTGTATTTITGSNRFRRLTNSKLVAYTIVFPNAVTSVDDWNLNGSEGNLITLSRTGGSGTFTINYSGTSYGIGRYLSISNSAATPANRMYAIFSTDGGSNTGWVFDAPKFGQFLTFFAPPI